MKKYNFYFHDDVDGLTCVALFYEFIRTRGGELGELFPLTYVSNFHEYWTKFEFKNPSVLVDFRYHPDPDWFFDHHPTSFLTNDWKARFEESKQKTFNDGYPSCFGLVFDSLIQHHDFKPSILMRHLRSRVDMLDSAQYPSAKYYVLMEGAIAKLDILLVHMRSNRTVPYRFLIKSLITKPLESIVHNKKYRRILSKIKSDTQKSLKKIPDKISIENNISILDAASFNTYLARFSDYYLYPDLEYSITIKPLADQFTVSLSKNPWSNNEPVVHAGELMKKYGGGGHRNAGGCEVDNKQNALQVAHQLRAIVVEALRK